MKESCHIWTGHVTYEWVTSHMNESRHMECLKTFICYIHMWHFICCMSWLIHVRHNSFTCDMPHSCVWEGARTHVRMRGCTCTWEGARAHERVHVRMRGCTCAWEGARAIVFLSLAMGWLRLVGSLKKYVSLAKETYKKNVYSAKETYIMKEHTNRSDPISLFNLGSWDQNDTRRQLAPIVRRNVMARLEAAPAPTAVSPTAHTHTRIHIHT